MEVVEDSIKSSRGSFRGSFHGSAHLLLWKRLPWNGTSGSNGRKQWKLADSLKVLEGNYNRWKFAEANGSKF